MITREVRVIGMIIVLASLLIGSGLMVTRLGQAFREIRANTEARDRAFARLDQLESQINDIRTAADTISARVEKALDEAPPRVILEQLEKSNRQTQDALSRIYKMLEGTRQEAIDRTSPDYRYEDMP